MSGKSIGSGLINEEGKIVKEIKETPREMSDRINENFIQSLYDEVGVGRYLTNYQNDGMGCPGEIPKALIEGNWEVRPLTKEELKATKLKRVK